MDNKDYAELMFLSKGAEQALLSGELSDWQHASTSTFHLLAQFILDINARLLAVAGPYPPTNQPILTATDLEDDRTL